MIQQIKEYIYYFNKKHPAGMGKNDINGFLSSFFYLIFGSAHVETGKEVEIDLLFCLAPQVGLEPTTYGLTVRRSNQLSY